MKNTEALARSLMAKHYALADLPGMAMACRERVYDAHPSMMALIEALSSPPPQPMGEAVGTIRDRDGVFEIELSEAAHDTDGGALDGRAVYLAPPAQAVESWIVVKQHAWDHGDGERPTLAYLWPSEFECKVYPSFEEASAFIKEGNWPLGFVAMQIAAPPAQVVDLGQFREIANDLSHSAKVDDYEPQHIAFLESVVERLRALIDSSKAVQS